ncbi:MAG: hypothetical protein FWC68_03485, partial [Oscillospiraceae bacterium]|nr:hypothetical protein [Oscillospiraceae bacterium]
MPTLTSPIQFQIVFEDYRNYANPGFIFANTGTRTEWCWFCGGGDMFVYDFWYDGWSPGVTTLGSGTTAIYITAPCC